MKKQFSQNLVKTEAIKNIISDIEKGLEFAMQKFPTFPCDPIHAVSVMCEESGESIQAALQWVYEFGSRDETRRELIHTAAMCIRVISGLDSNDILTGKRKYKCGCNCNPKHGHSPSSCMHDNYDNETFID